ncbi:uncharacterized protein PGTG_03943 [Puccinia graminis f. sp. tritici CRL 75-36-700-3]|uniref:Uncharacterized protein n=1 Tax=Puccinia graminis f. sp. tritici (strain CRL 75-36-700-3 / race SCCL) TaxID=418459 RepID=E3K112_PUCGT|nr:uncharacterized protein PGTG_03943 [Puccinia graminis f. sp. tritici CRL 75-36-700-3]EFP77987.2 hypothetical protein PGTG_03943 [Puccinia graminis f. sp. tritici CRL 75-36-700-3]
MVQPKHDSPPDETDFGSTILQSKPNIRQVIDRAAWLAFIALRRQTHEICSIRRASLYSIIWAFYQFKTAEAVGHPIEELIRTAEPAKALANDDLFFYPLLIYPDTTYLTSIDLEEDWQASHIHPLNHQLFQPSFILPNPASSSSRNDNTLTAPGTSGTKRKDDHQTQLSSSESIAQHFPPPSRGPSNAGIEERTPTESRDHDSLDDRSLNHTEPDVLLSPEVNTITHESKQHQECFQPTCVIPNGAILEPFLDEFYEIFQNKLFDKDYNAKRAPLNDQKHPSLPFCLKPSANQVSLRVTRILEESDGNSQDRRVLLMIYKLLIGWMYELHEIILNEHNIPIADYKTHQRPLFNWLLQELFEPSGSDPVFGLVVPPYPVWKSDFSDHHLGPIQIFLIRYFAGVGRDNRSAKPAASYLIETYLTQNKIDYSALSQPSSIKEKEDESFQLRINATYKEIMRFISTLEIDDDDFWVMISRFKNSQPIGVVEPLRILSLPEKKMVTPSSISRNFKLLSTALDFIHLQLLDKNSKLDSQNSHNLMRQKLFEWLNEMIFNPKDSLPIIGVVHKNGSLAPWDLCKEDTSTSNTSFGPIQERLIRFFSKEFINDLQEFLDILGFLLTHWIHSEHINQIKLEVHTLT